MSKPSDKLDELMEMGDSCLFEAFSYATEEHLEKIKHVLWVTQMERDHCPKKQKDFFREFDGIYMGDFFVEGDVVNHVSTEIKELSKQLDEGSMERVFYLRRWFQSKFGK